MSVLADRLLAVDAALHDAAIPHAFGGAIALAYCTLEPRATRDVDVNVFVGVDRVDEVLDAMPEGVRTTSRHRDTARRDGQVRLMWQDTPIDVFFDTDDFHHEVAQETVDVPFDGSTIAILGCEALIVFKAMFNRTRDWADIEAIFQAGAVDGPHALDRLRSLLGPGDPAVVRLRALVS
jgi:hypothetical protein